MSVVESNNFLPRQMALDQVKYFSDDTLQTIHLIGEPGIVFPIEKRQSFIALANKVARLFQLRDISNHGTRLWTERVLAVGKCIGMGALSSMLTACTFTIFAGQLALPAAFLALPLFLLLGPFGLLAAAPILLVPLATSFKWTFLENHTELREFMGWDKLKQVVADAKEIWNLPLSQQDFENKVMELTKEIQKLSENQNETNCLNRIESNLYAEINRCKSKFPDRANECKKAIEELDQLRLNFGLTSYEPPAIRIKG